MTKAIVDKLGKILPPSPCVLCKKVAAFVSYCHVLDLNHSAGRVFWAYLEVQISFHEICPHGFFCKKQVDIEAVKDALAGTAHPVMRRVCDRVSRLNSTGCGALCAASATARIDGSSACGRSVLRPLPS